jgi:hypothetical protein
VTDTDPTHGWKYTVLTRSGTRPHVGFQAAGNPNDQERFWARMNTLGTPGTVINVLIQSCTQASTDPVGGRKGRTDEHLLGGCVIM